MKPKVIYFRCLIQFFCGIAFVLFNLAPVNGQDDDTIEDAKISLAFADENDVHKIIATATDMNGDPIADLDLYFYVKRTFSNLPIGDVFNTTDEKGIVSVLFPNNLPGDNEGNVTILVKIMDSDLYNDLTLETKKNWGVPTSQIDQLDEKRSLWAASANAPISLILIVSTLIVSVWFIICYIVYILIKISKIKSTSS